MNEIRPFPFNGLQHALRVREIIPIAIHVTRTIQSPTTGVVLMDLDVRYEGPKPGALQHWRVGTWKKPPIDIALNPQTGALESVQVVLQDEAIPQRQLFGSPSTARVGWPILEIAHEDPLPRYVDVNALVDFGLGPENSVQASWFSRDLSVEHLSIPGGLDLFLANEVVIGIEFGPLSIPEVELLSRAQLH